MDYDDKTLSEDQQLWRALCAEVKPLGRHVPDIEPAPDYTAVSNAAPVSSAPPLPRVNSDDLARLQAWSRAGVSGGVAARSTRPGRAHLVQPVREIPRFYAHMEGRMQQRFRAGKITPEAVLDLHSLTEAEAAEVFRHFFYRARTRRLRCILVITGKGQGVLQRGLARWLEQPALKTSLLGVAPMPSHKGGSGAYSLYLRKE